MLARTLGRTLAELESTMGAGELLLWQALFRVEQWGELRADFRTASQMALMAEMKRDRKRRGKPFQVAEFMPKWWGDDAPESPQAMMAKFAALVGGADTP